MNEQGVVMRLVSAICKDKRIGLACAFCILTSGPFATLAKAAGRDGVWQIQITTQQGNCEKNFGAAFSLRKDDIVTGGESAFTADGAVETSGTMWVRLKKGRDLYRLQGKLEASSGSGSWSSNTRLCGGVWRGKRSGQ